jgi:hypothetical protein
MIDELQRTYRRKKCPKGRPKKRIPTAETIRRRQQKESRRRKAIRVARIVSGLCPYCGQEREEGFRMCKKCRDRWYIYNERARTKQEILATYA